MYPGLPERLQREMVSLAPSGTRVKVVDLPERRYSVWIGGSILASLSTFGRVCITREEYLECGRSAVHRGE